MAVAARSWLRATHYLHFVCCGWERYAGPYATLTCEMCTFSFLFFLPMLFIYEKECIETSSGGEVNESTAGDEGGDRGGRGRGAGGTCLLSEV